ncbi:hypothetical protein K470DRAFT_258624 [Piedraia hortae CBS 480.64]|uniref:Uncharacterized protein n=1 Tax=Piedraia hortae CBS 480.64 TaxID=1314780 RepID=A0A6A7BYJ5_9PEZI|nr:hypothetical protein K470DRAFT_258624 [Piedraia hortae CBS 480.64]
MSRHLQTLTHRLPPRLQRYTKPLLTAPKSHITAFLVLHEVTAIIPLFALAGTFHYSGWVPDVGGEWVEQGIRKWRRVLGRKGWISENEEGGGAGVGGEIGGGTSPVLEGMTVDGGGTSQGNGPTTLSSTPTGGDVDGGGIPPADGGEAGGGSSTLELAPKLVLEFATAWAITKVLLPVRLAASLYATPGLVRAVGVVRGRVRKRMGR